MQQKGLCILRKQSLELLEQHRNVTKDSPDIPYTEITLKCQICESHTCLQKHTQMNVTILAQSKAHHSILYYDVLGLHYWSHSFVVVFLM